MSFGTCGFESHPGYRVCIAIDAHEHLAGLEALFELTGDCVLLARADGTLTACNAAAQRVLGCRPGNGRRVSDLLAPESQRPCEDAVAAALEGRHDPVELVHESPDGTHTELSVTVARAGEGIVLLARDISDRKQAARDARDAAERLADQAEQLWQMAFRDPLTHLPNRTLLYDRIEQALARAQRENVHSTLLLVDLDRFKKVNDTLGHKAGDELLRQFADRMSDALRLTDSVSRLSGDEFAVLLGGADGEDECRPIIERLLAAVEEPFRVEGAEARIGMSVGMTSTRDARSADDLLRMADLGMYRAKERPGNTVVRFDSAMHDALVARASLEDDLRRALGRGQLVLHYQPIVSGADGSIHCFEALVRWNHPEQGLLCPDEFIPPAERSGLIHPLGRWVLAEACRQLAEWRRCGLAGKDLVMAVNVSPSQMLDGSFSDDVRRTIEAHGLQPEDVVLEVTESVFAAETAAARALDGLHLDGMGVSIDDFGTGFSSLSRLGALPVDQLKIDRSFVRGIDGLDSENPVTGAIVSMGQALGVELVAEGVENAEQLSVLRRAGCQFFQGYLLSRPVGPDAAAALLDGPPFAMGSLAGAAATG